MSMVIAVRLDAQRGPYIGFQADHEILECSECANAAAYRVLYTADQQSCLDEHRFAVHRVIDAEHPKHSDEIRVL